MRKVLLQQYLRQACTYASCGQKSQACQYLGEALNLAKSELNGLVQAQQWSEAMSLAKALNTEVKSIRFALMDASEKAKHMSEAKAGEGSLTIQEWQMKKHQIIDQLFEIMAKEGHVNYAQLATRLELVSEPAEAQDILNRAGLGRLLGEV